MMDTEQERRALALADLRARLDRLALTDDELMAVYFLCRAWARDRDPGGVAGRVGPALTGILGVCWCLDDTVLLLEEVALRLIVRGVADVALPF